MPSHPQELQDGVLISPVQCRMARAAVGWGVRELASASGVAKDTIVRLERGETLYVRTLAAIRAALERAGVEFISANGGGAGVRLCPSAKEAVRGTTPRPAGKLEGE